MQDLKRRRFIQNSALGICGALCAQSVNAAMTTPKEVEGPFYPITPQKDQDADLTQVEGKNGIAQGQIIEIYGQVFDQDSKPIENATIDLWQANSFGRYHHPHDNSSAPLDNNFQAWAILQSGTEGAYRLKTIVPGAYSIGRNSKRTPHIHFKISKKGYDSLLTQMYFPNQPLNEQDALFKRKSKKEQTMMTAKSTGRANEYRYDIFLAQI